MALTLANIKIEPCSVTWNSTEVGYTDGEVSISIEEQGTEVTAHQEGTNVLDMIRTGKSAELTVTLKETSIAQLKTMFTAGGAAFTPGGGSPTEVFGWGKSQDFTGMLADAQKLVIHPIVLGASVYTRDFAAWKAYPMLESLNWSGEDIQVLPITFKIFPDLTRETSVRLFVFGDHTQTI